MPDQARGSTAPGDLVGLVEEGRPRLAVVVGRHGSRADLRVGFSARSLSRGQRQLDPLAPLPAGSGVPAGIATAPWSLSRERLEQARPGRRSLAAAWLLLRDDGGALTLEDFTALVGDADDPAQRAACWLWLHGDQTLFRWRRQRVEARCGEDLHRLRREHRRRRLAEQARRRWRDALRHRRPVAVEQLGPEQRQDLDLLRAWAHGQTAEDLPDELRHLLQTAHCHADPGAIRHLLVDLGQWQPHHLPSLEGTRWRRGFGPELLAEADRLVRAAGDPRPGDETRRDRTGLHSLTIDDDDTEDIDDGLAIERLPGGGERLWIHIADPGRLIEADSPLDLEARRRGTSLYLATGILPMFPAALSTGPLSLRQGCRCAAWSVWAELAADGAVAASGLERSWVRPAYRLSYADADELIELAPPQEDHLARLHGLLERRLQWRLARGAVVLERPEGRIRSEAGQARLELAEPSPSRRLVAEAMILAGAVIADHGVRHGLALPFRSQLPASLPPAAELEALPSGPVRQAAILRHLGRGHVGSRPAPHFSLGLDAYVQASSPIRRYGDLLAQRQLRACLEGAPALAEPDLAGLLQQLEAPVRQGIQIAREDQRHWLQVWFEQQEQPQWPAVFLRWLRPQDQLGLVHLEDLAMDLAADCPPGSEPGQALLVRVQEVDSLRDRLRLRAAA